MTAKREYPFSTMMGCPGLSNQNGVRLNMDATGAPLTPGPRIEAQREPIYPALRDDNHRPDAYKDPHNFLSPTL